MANKMRDLHKVIYTSSYDRGLEHLLEMWPDIVKEVPDATLDIYYGWQLFDRFYTDNPSSMNWKKKMLEGMSYKGVTEHGRVPQPELKGIMEKCAIWAYPTHFGEINCISAMKAQAYGCMPVVINYAALQTTVQYGIKLDGDIYDQETKDKFKVALIDSLKNPMFENKRKEMMDWAQKKFAWSEVAKSWDLEFKGGVSK
jgi:glycosyltransferase involved in cell wall biosynthesis